jgi:hypothetical protein
MAGNPYNRFNYELHKALSNDESYQEALNRNTSQVLQWLKERLKHEEGARYPATPEAEAALDAWAREYYRVVAQVHRDMRSER